MWSCIGIVINYHSNCALLVKNTLDVVLEHDIMLDYERKYDRMCLRGAENEKYTIGNRI